MRIAVALGTSVDRLLGEEVDPGEIRLVRAEALTFRQAGTGEARYGFAALADGDGRRGAHETFLLELERGSCRAASAFHAGKELLMVLRGEVDVTLGTQTLTLGVGDYVEFPGRIPNVLTSRSVASRCIVIVLPEGD